MFSSINKFVSRIHMRNVQCLWGKIWQLFFEDNIFFFSISDFNSFWDVNETLASVTAVRMNIVAFTVLDFYHAGFGFISRFIIYICIYYAQYHAVPEVAKLLAKLWSRIQSKKSLYQVTNCPSFILDSITKPKACLTQSSSILS